MSIRPQLNPLPRPLLAVYNPVFKNVFHRLPDLEFSHRLWGHAMGSVGIALWAEMSLLTLCCCSHYKRSSETAAASLPLESCDNNCVWFECVCACVRLCVCMRTFVCMRTCVCVWESAAWVWEREDRIIKTEFYCSCQSYSIISPKCSTP